MSRTLPEYKQNPVLRRILKFAIIAMVLPCMTIGGCGGKTEIKPGVEVFNFIHHPEAYMRTEGMPEFGELLGEIQVKPMGAVVDLRRGFKWDWSSPLSFVCEFPENPVLSFEWGFSTEVRRLNREFTLTAAVEQGGNEDIVFETSGRAGQNDNTQVWKRERIALEKFEPGKAEVSFEFKGLSGKEAEENFILANPRVFSPNVSDARHVIMIGVDTLRADHMSCYGYERPTTPNLDKWSDGGTRYDYCIATSPWTFTSFASMLAGRYPSVCGATSNIRFLPDDETTIAEAFSAAGFATYAVTDSPWVSPAVNDHQGFDGFLEYPHVRCEPIFESGREWIKEHADQDTFVFLHFMDPHLDWNPPGKFNNMYDPEYSGRYKNKYLAGDAGRVRNEGAELTDAEVEHLVALYDGEISYFDDEFGKFLGFLDGQDMSDNTLLIFTSDHGEEFFEHGGFTHGHCLYDEVIHVPLIIGGMGYPAGGVDGRISSTIDIYPTVLNFLDLPIPEGLNGLNLLAPPPETERYLISEQLVWGLEQKCVTIEEYRYIYHAVTGDEELYDLYDDRKMFNSVAEDRRATARGFRAFLTNYTIGQGAPWHLFFILGSDEEAESVSYSGTVTAPDGFANVEKLRIDDTDSLSLETESFEFKVDVVKGHPKEFRFVTNNENANITFEFFKNGQPLSNAGIFIGPEFDPMMDAQFNLNINDERFGLGRANIRPMHNGIFIWAIPTRFREQLQPNLTPEMEAELRSLGYLN